VCFAIGAHIGVAARQRRTLLGPLVRTRLKGHVALAGFPARRFRLPVSRDAAPQVVGKLVLVAAKALIQGHGDHTAVPQRVQIGVLVHEFARQGIPALIPNEAHV